MENKQEKNSAFFSEGREWYTSIYLAKFSYLFLMNDTNFNAVLSKYQI